jgi:2-dehydropantoate 2-reductase
MMTRAMTSRPITTTPAISNKVKTTGTPMSGDSSSAEIPTRAPAPRFTPLLIVVAVARYLIIGAGAIGGGIGARLLQAGHQVVLVARGDHLRALQEHGLRLRTPEEDVVLPVTAVAGPDDMNLRPDDVLVLATKTHQAPDALATWADVEVAGGGTAGEQLPILTALNGVVSEDLALRYFARVYGVCVWMWAAHLTPGEVILEGVPASGVFHVGRVPARSADDADAGFLDQLRSDWTPARLTTVLPPDVMAWKYRKLLSNVGNAIQALLGRQPGVGELVRAAEAEGRSVLDAAGIDYTSDEEEAAARAKSFTVKPVPGLPEFLGGSTWQSLSRGTGNVETDYLNGELVRIARQHQMAAPINAKLAALARRAARTHQQPGELSVDELARQLGLQPPSPA